MSPLVEPTSQLHDPVTVTWTCPLVRVVMTAVGAGGFAGAGAASAAVAPKAMSTTDVMPTVMAPRTMRRDIRRLPGFCRRSFMVSPVPPDCVGGIVTARTHGGPYRGSTSRQSGALG